jgi:hypothetical protein
VALGGGGPDRSVTDGYVWVRTDLGWEKMTVEQERVWRRSFEERVNFAKMMNNMLGGSY